MVSAWTKIFEDGTKEYGTDYRISTGSASWTRGQLNNIVEVQLSNRIMLASLSVPNTSWHQFDHFIVVLDLDTSKPKRICRVVQAEIKEHHKDMFLIKDCYNKYSFSIVVTSTKNTESIQITEEMIGKWITLVIYETGEPYMNLSEKGNFYGNK